MASLYIATLQDAVSIKIKDIHKTVVFSLPCNNGISGVVGTESSQESSSYDARAAHRITGERKKEVPTYHLFLNKIKVGFMVLLRLVD